MTDIGSPNCCCQNYHPWVVYEYDTDYAGGNSVGGGCASESDDPYPERLVRVPVVVVVDCHWGEPDDLDYCTVAQDSTALIHWAEIDGEPVLQHKFSQGLRDEGAAYAWHLVCTGESCAGGEGGVDKIILVDWSQVGDDGTEASVIAHHDFTASSDGIGVFVDEDGLVTECKIRWEPVGFNGLNKNFGWGLQTGNELLGFSGDSSEVYMFDLNQSHCDILHWSRSGSSITYNPWENPNNGSASTGDTVTLHGDMGRNLSEAVEWDLEYELDNWYDGSCANGVKFGLRTFRSIPAPMAVAYRDPRRCIGVRIEHSGIVDEIADGGVIRYAPDRCVWHWDGIDGPDYDFRSRISLVGGVFALEAHPNPAETDDVLTIKGLSGGGAASLPPDELWYYETEYAGRAYHPPYSALGSGGLHQGVTPYMYDGHSAGDCIAFTSLELQGDDVVINHEDTSLAGGGSACGECDEGWDDDTDVTKPKLQYGQHSIGPGHGAGDFVLKWNLKNRLMINGAVVKTEHLFTVTQDALAPGSPLTWVDGPDLSKYAGGGLVDSTTYHQPWTTAANRAISPIDYCPSIHCCSDGQVAAVWWDQAKTVDTFTGSAWVEVETMRWKVEFTGAEDSPVSQRQNIAGPYGYGPFEWSNPGGLFSVDNARIQWPSYRPRVQWSSDRWIYVYDFPLLTKLDGDGNQVEGVGYLGSRLSSEVVMDQLDYPGANSGIWKTACFRNLPEYRRTAHKTNEIYNPSDGYAYGSRVWYPDADGSEYTCVKDDGSFVATGVFDTDDWEAEEGHGWMWRDWMVSVEGDIWIPIGCRDENNTPWATSHMYQDDTVGWKADALCQSRGANEVPLIPPRQDHGRRRPEHPW